MSRKYIQAGIGLLATVAFASVHADEQAVNNDATSKDSNRSFKKQPRGERMLARALTTAEKIVWRPLVSDFESIHLRITGPGIEPYETSFSKGDAIEFGFYDEKSTIWANGLYTWELTSTPKVSEETRILMAAAREETTADNIGDVLRENGVISYQPGLTQSGTFRIHEGQAVRLESIVEPSRTEALKAAKAEATGSVPDVDQADGVQLRPFIGVVGNNSIDGSLCVGFDCVANENFGFDTIRLKENNLRLDFQDTSNTASFPPNDWRIIINDSANGGANHFSVEDRSGGNQVFRVFAGARNNALVVDSQGDLGLGTSTPAVDIDIKTGDSPTVRLQQDGTSGFTPQTWDLAGNETNFFIRDATNGSTLPFRVRPGAPTSALDIEGGSAPTEGSIGIGTASPDALVHIDQRGDQTEPSLLIDNDTGSGADVPFVVTAAGNVGIGVAAPTQNLAIAQDTGSLQSNQALRIDANGGDFIASAIIDQATTSGNGIIVDVESTSSTRYIADFRSQNASVFRLGADGTAEKPGGGTWSAPSDERLKKNIQPLDGALDKMLKLRGVEFEYKDPASIGQYSGPQMGMIAQEVEKVFPDWISEGHDGFKRLTVRGFSALTANAFEELRAEKDAEIEALRQKTEAMEAQLKMIMERISDDDAASIQDTPVESPTED